MLQGECVRSPRLHGADKTQSGLDDAGLVHVHVPLSWALRGGRVLDSNDDINYNQEEESAAKNLQIRNIHII